LQTHLRPLLRVAIRKCFKKQRKGKCRKTRVRNNCKLTCGLC